LRHSTIFNLTRVHFCFYIIRSILFGATLQAGAKVTDAGLEIVKSSTNN